MIQWKATASFLDVFLVQEAMKKGKEKTKTAWQASRKRETASPSWKFVCNTSFPLTAREEKVSSVNRVLLFAAMSCSKAAPRCETTDSVWGTWCLSSAVITPCVGFWSLWNNFHTTPFIIAWRDGGQRSS